MARWWRTRRRTFSRVTLADRVYGTIRGSQAARALPPWRPADAAGASGVRVFVRRSGAPLTEGVPGFYTVDGFYKVLLPNLPARDQAGRQRKLGARQGRADRSYQSAGADAAA